MPPLQPATLFGRRRRRRPDSCRMPTAVVLGCCTFNALPSLVLTQVLAQPVAAVHPPGGAHRRKRAL